MGSKLGYIYFREICSPRSPVYPKILNHSIWMNDGQVMAKKQKKKNMGFEKILTASSIKTQHFLYIKIPHLRTTTNQTTKNNIEQPIKTLLFKFGVFPNPNTRKGGLGFGLLTSNLFQFFSFFFFLFFIT